MQQGQKISLFINSANVGGAELVMLKLAQEFAERGILVEVVLGRYCQTLLDVMPPNIKVVSLNAKGSVSAIVRLTSYFRQMTPNTILSTLLGSNLIASLAHLLS